MQRKTAGNAFFVKRFLLYLHQAGLLRFDPDHLHGRWDWDAAGIESADREEFRVDGIDFDYSRITIAGKTVELR